ncbi:MAG: ChbG/HpnK family deacetylase [Clostridia bacterium]|nr:ChbG/HpnK family deacetylase [Clostridia bacterium]
MQGKIIVNADDFGLTETCSKAIARAFSENLISSTTACANGSFIEQAIALAEEKGFIGKIGVHLNVTEGEPLTEQIKTDAFFCENGKFHGKIDRYKKPSEKELKDFTEEITAQIKRLILLGVKLTHVDSHHHIHTAPYLIDTVKKVAKEFGIEKIRLHRNLGKIRFYKKVGKYLFNKKLKKDGFTTALKFGSLDDAISCGETLNKYLCEIMVHPDFDKDGKLIDRKHITENGNVGEPLNKIKKVIGDKTLISYGEL